MLPDLLTLICVCVVVRLYCCCSGEWWSQAPQHNGESRGGGLEMLPKNMTTNMPSGARTCARDGKVDVSVRILSYKNQGVKIFARL